MLRLEEHSCRSVFRRKSLVPFPTNLLGDSCTAPAPTNWKVSLRACLCRHGPMLALYCHGRAHLQSIALAVAATCGEKHLEAAGGPAGLALFRKSRAAPPAVHTSHYMELQEGDAVGTVTS